MRDNSSFAQLMTEKSPDAALAINSGGRANNGQYANVGDNITNPRTGRQEKAFTPSHITTDEDRAKLSTSAIKRGGRDGWITGDDAEHVLHSNVQSVMSRLDSDKRAAFETIMNTNNTNSVEQSGVVGSGENFQSGVGTTEMSIPHDNAVNSGPSPRVVSSAGYTNAASGRRTVIRRMSDGTYQDASTGETISDMSQWKMKP
jgi:hypothetical protein